MFKNKSKIFTISVFLILTVTLIFVNPLGNKYDKALNKSLKSIDSDKININSVIPFEWDTIYTFPAYTDKATIEEEIGIGSRKIKENNINEGMVHLIFIKGDKVVTTILGCPENLGYDIIFDHKITFDEDAVFSVKNQNDIVILKKL